MPWAARPSAKPRDGQSVTRQPSSTYLPATAPTTPVLASDADGPCGDGATEQTKTPSAERREITSAPSCSPLRVSLAYMLSVRNEKVEAAFQRTGGNFGLAVMLAAEGNLDGARSALESAVRALPGYALAQENLGDVYLRMAARAYERAAQLDPKASAAREKLTLARELLGRVAPPPAR